MGRRTATETLSRLVVAFLKQRTWTQKQLEAECAVTARTVRKCLFDLLAAGMPLERSDEPPHVYWAVPSSWPPRGGRGLESVDGEAVARLVARLPRSSEREAVLAKLVVPAFGSSLPANQAEDRARGAVLATLEDAARRGAAVRMGYYSASRRADSTRVASVQRVVYGDRPRFVAHCHSSSQLKWFRVDRVHGAAIDTGEPFVRVEEGELTRFLRDSMDGYHAGGESLTCELWLRAAESRWVLDHMPYERGTAIVSFTSDGAHVVLRTAALDVLARYLVGLGDAARALGPPKLTQRVVELAQASLRAHDAPAHARSPRPLRSTRGARVTPLTSEGSETAQARRKDA